MPSAMPANRRVIDDAELGRRLHRQVGDAARLVPVLLIEQQRDARHVEQRILAGDAVRLHASEDGARFGEFALRRQRIDADDALIAIAEIGRLLEILEGGGELLVGCLESAEFVVRGAAHRIVLGQRGLDGGDGVFDAVFRLPRVERVVVVRGVVVGIHAAERCHFSSIALGDSNVRDPCIEIKLVALPANGCAARALFPGTRGLARRRWRRNTCAPVPCRPARTPDRA